MEQKYKQDILAEYTVHGYAYITVARVQRTPLAATPALHICASYLAVHFRHPAWSPTAPARFLSPTQGTSAAAAIGLLLHLHKPQHLLHHQNPSGRHIAASCAGVIVLLSPSSPWSVPNSMAGVLWVLSLSWMQKRCRISTVHLDLF
jgi:hypothetical protein